MQVSARTKQAQTSDNGSNLMISKSDKPDEVHDQIRLKRQPTISVDYVPCFDVIAQYRLSYMTTACLVSYGYIRQFSAQHRGLLVPQDLMALFNDYAFEFEAGLFQIAYHLHRALIRMRQRAISETMLKKLIEKYVATTDENEIAFCCQQFVRIGLIQQGQLVSRARRLLLGEQSTRSSHLYKISEEMLLRYDMQNRK